MGDAATRGGQGDGQESFCCRRRGKSGRRPDGKSVADTLPVYRGEALAMRVCSSL